MYNKSGQLQLQLQQQQQQFHKELGGQTQQKFTTSEQSLLFQRTCSVKTAYKLGHLSGVWFSTQFWSLKLRYADLVSVSTKSCSLHKINRMHRKADNSHHYLSCKRTSTAQLLLSLPVPFLSIIAWIGIWQQLQPLQLLQKSGNPLVVSDQLTRCLPWRTFPFYYFTPSGKRG